MKLAAVIAAAVALTGAAATGAKAQSAQAMFDSFSRQQNAQMSAVLGGIVQSNVNNPQVVAMWRQNPRGMSLQQYAGAYAATGGFTPQGYANYNNTTRQIAAQDAASVAGYRQAQANFGNAIQNRNNAASANMYQAGLGLMGQQTYYGPQGGVNLSYMPNATPWTQGGYTYYQANRGNAYVAVGPGGAYWSAPR